MPLIATLEYSDISSLRGVTNFSNQVPTKIEPSLFSCRLFMGGFVDDESNVNETRPGRLDSMVISSHLIDESRSLR
jgi:hypothetical protein